MIDFLHKHACALDISYCLQADKRVMGIEYGSQINKLISNEGTLFIGGCRYESCHDCSYQYIFLSVAMEDRNDWY